MKYFDVHDRGTRISVGAIRLDIDNPLVRLAGFGRPTLLVIVLGPKTAISTDAYQWMYGRTMREAHLYLEKHFDDLPTGSVINVEELYDLGLQENLL